MKRSHSISTKPVTALALLISLSLTSVSAQTSTSTRSTSGNNPQSGKHGSKGNPGNNNPGGGNPGNNNPGGGNPGTSNVGRKSANGNPGTSTPNGGNPSNGNPGANNPGNNNPSNGNPGNNNPGHGNPPNGNPGNSNPSFSEGGNMETTKAMRMPNGDVVQVVKGNQGPVHNASFSKPVRNLVMKVSSSSHDTESVLVFDREFVVSTQDPSCGEAGYFRRCLIKEGNVLRVMGGAGSIRFIDKTDSLAFTVVSTDADLSIDYGVSQFDVIQHVPPCDLGCARTLTQGGWSNRSRTSPLNDHWFAENFPHGLTIGEEGRSVTLTTVAAVRAFLPNGGTPTRLTEGDYQNLNNKHVKNVLAGQVTAAMLNVALNPGITAAVLQGHLPYAGYTVQDVINMANAALGADDCHMPSKHIYSQLTEALDAINQSFPDGHSRHHLSCPEEH